MEFLCNNNQQVVENEGNLFEILEYGDIFFYSRATCSTVFVVRNVQIYFDECSTCAGARNLALRRLLANITALQRSLNLFVNNGTTTQVSAQICSTPNITRLSNTDSAFSIN